MLIVNAAEDDDVAGAGRIDLDSLEAVETVEFEDATIAHITVCGHQADRRVGADATALDSADTQDADVAVVVETGHLQLQTAVGVDGRW